MSILVLKSDVLRYILYANSITKNYTERVVHTICIRKNLHFLPQNNFYSFSTLNIYLDVIIINVAAIIIKNSDGSAAASNRSSDAEI